MKFYHVRPKSSLKERRLTVKDLIVTFFLIIFLSVRCRACDFGRYRPHTTSYDGVIEKLRTHLPTDYNLTIFLDPAGLDSCCEDLQVMLSLKQSIGHLYRHSVGPLQDLTFKVLGELGFLKDCPVRESFNCEMKRLDSPHLFRKLLEHFRSYDNKFELKQCDFERCTLYNCVTDPSICDRDGAIGIDHCQGSGAMSREGQEGKLWKGMRREGAKQDDFARASV
uniref:uncharacterized protein isoform X1 n=1 Tax=Pristiophorus japonicus TaxID=55135 RepID=UPI00398E6D25